MQGKIKKTESAAFILDRAAHSLILEGRDAFDREYVVSDGPINPKTGGEFEREWENDEGCTEKSGSTLRTYEVTPAFSS